MDTEILKSIVEIFKTVSGDAVLGVSIFLIVDLVKTAIVWGFPCLVLSKLISKLSIKRIEKE